MYCSQVLLLLQVDFAAPVGYKEPEVESMDTNQTDAMVWTCVVKGCGLYYKGCGFV